MAKAVEVLEKGTGEPVVLVHGDVFGAAMTWPAQDPLSERFQLRLVNRRGFGNSTDTEAEDFEVDARDVDALLGGGAHLVGHSYGGVVALLAAAERPEDVRSLTVFEPPAFALTAEHADTQALTERIRSILAAQPTAEEFLPQFIAAVGGDPARLPRPLPPPLVKAASVQLHGRWPWEAEIPLDALALTPFPKLVVSGGHSSVFDGICDVLETQLPAQRAVLPGAGHSIPTLGQPVNDLLSTFWTTATSK
jgi:pimeloyl-ACP methyl ester carboxylesterase